MMFLACFGAVAAAVVSIVDALLNFPLVECVETNVIKRTFPAHKVKFKTIVLSQTMTRSTTHTVIDPIKRIL
jgi:hypothetical protein